MRLNWNNIGKGLEGIADAKKARDLAQESERYNVTEGAYGQGLSENLQQVISARDQALQTLGEQASPEERQRVLDQYTPAMSELSRRVGLEAPDYSVASGAQNFATRQEARQAAAPLRAEGLAGVYRRYGDVEKADALETRAYEQQRALAAETRAASRENREEQAFATQQTLTGLDIKQRTRTEAELQRETDFAAFAAERPNATTQELKDAAFKEFGFTPKQWQAAVNTRLGIADDESKLFKSAIKTKMQGKNLQQLGSLYNTDSDFDDKTDLAIVPGKGGAVTLNFIDKASGKVTGSQSFSNEALATEYLNKQATEPEIMGSWMVALREKEAGIKAKEASANKDNRMGDYYAGGGRENTKDVQKKITDIEKVLDRKLTDEEKSTLVGLTPKSNPNQTMTDKEKLDYAAYMKALAELPETATAAERDALAAKYRVEKFTGGGGKPAMPAAPAPAASPPTKAKTALQTATPEGQQLLDLRGLVVPNRPASVYNPPTLGVPPRGLLPTGQRSINGSF